MITQISDLKKEILDIETTYKGNAAKNEIGEKTKPTIGGRLFSLNRGITVSTYGPTETHKQTAIIIQNQLDELNKRLKSATRKFSTLARRVQDAGGPWIEGQD